MRSRASIRLNDLLPDVQSSPSLTLIPLTSYPLFLSVFFSPSYLPGQPATAMLTYQQAQHAPYGPSPPSDDPCQPASSLTLSSSPPSSSFSASLALCYSHWISPLISLDLSSANLPGWTPANIFLPRPPPRLQQQQQQRRQQPPHLPQQQPFSSFSQLPQTSALVDLQSSTTSTSSATMTTTSSSSGSGDHNTASSSSFGSLAAPSQTGGCSPLRIHLSLPTPLTSLG